MVEDKDKKEESKLEKLKIAYSKIQEKHGLPDFKKMNEDFHIEKLADPETETLIREVRKFVGDKLANYMRFVENLLNPVNVPIFIFSIVKILDADQKKVLEDIFKELMKIEVRFIELDVEFNEEKEAAFIKESFESWQGMKKEMMKIMNSINSKWDEKSENNSKNYFG